MSRDPGSSRRGRDRRDKNIRLRSWNSRVVERCPTGFESGCPWSRPRALHVPDLSSESQCAQASIEHLESLVCVVAGEGQGGPQLEDIAVVARQTHQDSLATYHGDDVFCVRRLDGLTAVAVANEVDAPEQARTLHVADDLVIPGERCETELEVLTYLSGVL